MPVHVKRCTCYLEKSLKECTRGIDREAAYALRAAVLGVSHASTSHADPDAQLIICAAVAG